VEETKERREERSSIPFWEEKLWEKECGVSYLKEDFI
jgi:hypothetical protein